MMMASAISTRLDHLVVGGRDGTSFMGLTFFGDWLGSGLHEPLCLASAIESMSVRTQTRWHQVTSEVKVIAMLGQGGPLRD
jgi:hypothetical protein